MARYTAEILWQRGDQDFLGNSYSRRHSLRFDGGAEVPGSSSPHVVPLPFSDAAAVDPEEAFVASLSSCHMLWFLDFAARRGLVVERYTDAATGRMGADTRGRMSIVEVVLAPHVVFSGARQPGAGEVEALHHEAHEHCNIANSIRAEVRVEGRWSRSEEA